MKEWLTAQEIADEALPGAPGTKRGVTMLADRDGWNDHPAFARKRAGRGGGMEYHYRILPTLAQVTYAHRYLAVSTPTGDEETEVEQQTGQLTERAQIERDARLAIVHAFNRYTAGLSRSNVAAKMQLFTDNYNAGRIAVDEWVSQTIPNFSKRSLTRWRQAVKQGKVSALAADPGKSRKGTGVLDEANDGRIREWMLALVAHQPFLSARRVRDACRHEFGDTISHRGKSVAMPPVRTFQHTLKRLKGDNHVVLTKLTNPDAYRSTMAPAGTGTLGGITEPNQLWQIDASPVDALCVDGRHSMYACIDIATRRTVIYISRTPRASAVMLLIRKAILAFGVPQTIKTDNGSDFVARDTRRLLDALGIEIELSDAYSPQQKGHVERVIRTFQHDCGPLLPGFIGHSVADRKAIESRKSFAARLGESDAETFGVSLSAADLQKHVDDWTELSYQHRPHQGLKGKTPAQAAREATTAIRSVDARALDVLLMPVAGKGLRTVTKFGIRIDGNHYMSAELLPGTPVLVRHDPLDMGKVYAFTPDGAQFLAEAVCPALAGVHPQTFVRALKEARKELLDKASRQVAKDMREIAKGPALIERVMEVARRDIPNVVELPKRSESHTTPQIDAAARAKEPLQPNHSGNTATLQEKLLSEETAGTSNITPIRAQETRHQRFRRALELEEDINAGRPVSDHDRGWLTAYRTGTEYRTMKDIFDDSEGSMSL